MKKVFPIILLLVFLTSCGENINSVDLDKDPLRGTLNAEEWTALTGSGLYQDFTNSVSGLFVDFELNDPCALRATLLNNVEIQVPAYPNTYTLSVSPYTKVIFHLQGGVQYTVPSGFIQVVKVTQNTVIGYLSADLDEENVVQGSFLLPICN